MIDCSSFLQSLLNDAPDYSGFRVRCRTRISAQFIAQLGSVITLQRLLPLPGSFPLYKTCEKSSKWVSPHRSCLRQALRNRLVRSFSLGSAPSPHLPVDNRRYKPRNLSHKNRPSSHCLDLSGLPHSVPAGIGGSLRLLLSEIMTQTSGSTSNRRSQIFVSALVNDDKSLVPESNHRHRRSYNATYSRRWAR